MDWSKIPDLMAIASLACAFYSISRRDRTPQQHLWLIGWILIGGQLLCSLFARLPGVAGLVGTFFADACLIAAGVFFMWATVPDEPTISSRRMAAVTLGSMSLYACLAFLPHAPDWALDLSAAFIAVGPLAVAMRYLRYRQHMLRWLTVGLQLALGAELLVLRRQTGDNLSLCVHVILFVVYLSCCLYFWYSHPKATTGSIITVGGFLAWALVFLLHPLLTALFPTLVVEYEVWNLPTYVVAIGMLLLLLEKQIERSQYLALHDDLTSLANRRLFQDRLSEAMERAKRQGTSVALLQVDLDRFKEVNDTYGHPVGDLLLQHVGTQLKRRVRPSDTVARTGGDEFSIILEVPADHDAAVAVAESMVRSLSEPVRLGGSTISIGASVGVALYPQDAQDTNCLYVEADMRMYRMKQSRRGNEAKPPMRAPAGLGTRTIAS